VTASPAQDTESTYVKLASLNILEQRNSSVRSSSFTLSSLHSDEQSESEEEFGNSDSFKSGSNYDSENSHSISEQLSEGELSYAEHDEMKSIDSSGEGSDGWESERGSSGDNNL